MSELDAFKQPDLTMTIDRALNGNFVANVRRAPRNRTYPVEFPSDEKFKGIQTQIVTLRAELTARSKEYNNFLNPAKTDKLSCDLKAVRPLWEYTADPENPSQPALFIINKSGPLP